jgi:Uma2 family endonuclease
MTASATSFSPGDSYTEVREKIQEWLRSGTNVVVIVDPAMRAVTVYRAEGPREVTDAIEIEDLIPGWRLPLAELFDDD